MCLEVVNITAGDFVRCPAVRLPLGQRHHRAVTDHEYIVWDRGRMLFAVNSK